jgi:hypothetical protein
VMPQLDRSIPKERIERRAYEIYLQRGGRDGYDIADWIIAEQELMEDAKARKDATARSLGGKNFAAYELSEEDVELLLKDLYGRGAAPSQREPAQGRKILEFTRDSAERGGDSSLTE